LPGARRWFLDWQSFALRALSVYKHALPVQAAELYAGEEQSSEANKCRLKVRICRQDHVNKNYKKEHQLYVASD